MEPYLESASLLVGVRLLESTPDIDVESPMIVVVVVSSDFEASLSGVRLATSRPHRLASMRSIIRFFTFNSIRLGFCHVVFVLLFSSTCHFWLYLSIVSCYGPF